MLVLQVGYHGERDEQELPHGTGRWRSADGNMEYSGQWAHGLFHGKGLLRLGREGCLYSGEWKAGR